MILDFSMEKALGRVKGMVFILNSDPTSLSF